MMTTAHDTIDNFRAVSEENFIFACQASVPLVFTPELLYQLWNNFKQFDYAFKPGAYHKISHIAVSDLLLSPLCESVGFEIFRLKKDVRKILAEELIGYLGRTRRNTIAKFLQEYARIESNFQHRKKLKTIHALTAQAVLDPAEMERQIVHQINDAKTDAEKIDLLMLHKNIVPDDHESDLVIVTKTLDDKLNPMLVIEEDPDAQGVLTVHLPRELRARIRKKTITPKAEEPKKKSLAEQLIEGCIKNTITDLDLGFCGLTDADFAKGGVIDRELRRCIHLRGLSLGNLPLIGPDGERLPNKNKGERNHLNFIPECIGELTNLETFVCSGTVEDPWGIQDLSTLLTLKNLRILDLRFNRIQHIPSLPSAPFLSYLFLSSNEIADLASISSCTNLKSLDISSNRIVSLKPLIPLLERTPEPMEVNSGTAKETRENVIWVRENPIMEPPPHVVEKGRAGILEYFSAKTSGGSQLLSPVGFIVSEAYGQQMNGILIEGAQLHPALDGLCLITVASEVKGVDGYPSDLKVVFPGYETAFRISHAVWSSPFAKLNFILWEFAPADREKLKGIIGKSSTPLVPIAKTILTEGENIHLIAYTGKEIISKPAKISGHSARRITFTTDPGRPSEFFGSALLTTRHELIGINTGMRFKESAVSMPAIQAELDKVLTYGKYKNGNILRICVLYSSDAERDVGELTSHIDRRLRKYWIEQQETFIELTLLSEQQIVSDNDFPAALWQSDILLALPGNPSVVRMYHYIQNVLIELFRADEEKPGPTVYIFTKNRLSLEFQRWVTSMHAATETYLSVDNIITYLESNLNMMALSKRYQLIRETMPGGNQRTAAMENLVEEMRKNSEGILRFLPLYMNSASPGKRLSAIAALETRPDPKYVLWLAGRVGDDETPFAGFRATVSLSAAYKHGYTDHLLRDATDTAWANLKLSSFKDPNQVAIIEDLRSKMRLTRPIKSKASMLAGSWKGSYADSVGNTFWDLEIILRENNKLIGVIRDNGPLGKADIHGEIAPDRNFISFIKKYRRRDKNYYEIEYTGEWKTPDLVTGKWTIHGKTITTGTFEMKKVEDIDITSTIA